MTREVLEVIADLARAGQTTVHVFAGGQDVEQGPPERVLGDPQHEVTRAFLKETGL
jgi:ABC-type histidine transport system ATPase subunit